MAITYDTLLTHYPTMSKNELYDKLGGEWPTLKDNPNYQNTCAIRLSHALNESGNQVPDDFKEAIDGKGRSIILKVATFNKYMEKTFGQFTWAVSKNPHDSYPLKDIPSIYKGIIAYHADFSDATGHFDLWSGTDFIGPGTVEGIKKGFDILLWDLQVKNA